MPYQRPNLKTLIDRADADMASRLPGTEAQLRRSNVGALARIHAGAVHGLYGFLDYLSRQVLPDTAEVDWLERHASIYNITRKAAVSASGKVRFTGTTGTALAKGIKMQTARQQVFVTTAQVALKAGQADVPIEAETAGKAGNIKADTDLTLVTPIAGVQSKAVALAPGIQGGTEQETDDSLRRRLLARIQAPPHGGNRADYVAWAQAMAGVGRAWVYPEELGLGTVSVRFVKTDGAIPTAAWSKKSKATSMPGAQSRPASPWSPRWPGRLTSRLARSPPTPRPCAPPSRPRSRICCCARPSRARRSCSVTCARRSHRPPARPIM